jgi:hypothetical protein
MADDEGLLTRFQLRVDADADLLICSYEACRFTLTSNLSQVDRHLREKHRIPPDIRRKIADCLRAYHPTLQDPAEAPLRQDGSFHDTDLLVYDEFYASSAIFVQSASRSCLATYPTSTKKPGSSYGWAQGGYVRPCTSPGLDEKPGTGAVLDCRAG